MSRSFARLCGSAACAAALVAVAACGSDEDGGGEPVAATPPDQAIVAQIPDWDELVNDAAPADGTYVGEAGSDTSVGFVVQGDKVVVYVCDGKQVGDWFGGEVKDGRFNLESERGTRIDGEITESHVSGTLTLEGGSALDYTAEPAKKGATGIGVGAGEGELKRRWIQTESALRGTDGNGGGGVKNGVAIAQPVDTSTGTGVAEGGGGGSSGQQQVECHNYVTAGCSTSCAQLASEYLQLKKNPKRNRIQIANYEKQFDVLGSGGGCIED